MPLTINVNIVADVKVNQDTSALTRIEQAIAQLRVEQQQLNRLENSTDALADAMKADAATRNKHVKETAIHDESSNR